MLRSAVKTLLVAGQGAAANRAKGAASSAARSEKWDILAGVLVERLPVITKTLKPIEKQYLAHLHQIEFEKSLKSDFEMREEKDRMISELQQRGKLDVDIDAAVQLNAQDLKDMWKEEMAQYHFEPRLTEADRSGDTSSLRRRLENTLVLLVEQRVGGERLRLLPQGARRQGETMRQAAERVLRERCGDRLDAVIYGNAPCGFYKYKYPVDQRSETIGAKVFFYRAAYRSGSIATESEAAFEWLDREETLGRVPAAYSASLSQILL